MHKYLKSAMDFLESNMTVVMIAVLIAMLAGGLMYWKRREGLATKEEDEDDLEDEMDKLEEEEEEEEDE